MTLTKEDQAAINHIASVSKHPHAAMIVKWLITGWDVIRKDDPDNIIISPRWQKGEEYELIEPKPAKPAYRVYKHKSDNTTCTVDRNAKGKTDHGLPPDCEWISDWIEYDLPNKWPTPLVERIATIDIKAAEWIVEHWDDLSTDEYNFEGRYSRESEKLKTMFSWGQSGIDNHIWYRISEKLGE